MLQNESILSVVDNSGAKKILVIRCLGGSNRRYSRIGDLVIATVKKAEANKFTKKEEKVVMALIVATRRYFRRQNNTWIKFSKNCAILVEKKDKKIKPRGNRIFVPLLAEFSQWGYENLFKLKPEIL